MRRFAAVLLALLAVPLPVRAAGPWDIVPCKAIGLLELGTDTDRVQRLWGRPSKVELTGEFSVLVTGPRSGQLQRQTSYIWAVTYPERGLVLWATGHKEPVIVKGASVVNANRPYATDKGIKIGDSLLRVVAAYGQDAKFRRYESLRSYLANAADIELQYDYSRTKDCDSSGGISFTLRGPSKEERVVAITTFHNCHVAPIPCPSY